MNKNNNDNALKMACPLFSIVIPVFNVNLTYFDECMRSLLNQTVYDIEIVIVDDGSDLSCAKACDAYADRDSRVRVIHQNNQGVSAARNRGITETNAKWILFVDADDWLELNSIEIIYNQIKESSYDIVFFDFVLEYANKNEKVRLKLEPGIYDSNNLEVKELLYLEAMGPKSNQYGNITYCWGKVYNRQFLLENSITFPVGIPKSEDKVFILRCFNKLGVLLKTSDCLYHYRINSLSVCNKYTKNADTDRAELIQILMNIAAGMDNELSILKNNSSYNEVTKKCEIFAFGIITDILKLKHYHKDYPRNKNSRKREVRSFLESEPYKSIISNISYSDLSFEARMKKFLLSYNMVELFYKVKHFKQALLGRVAK